MISKRRLLKGSRLCVIIDLGVTGVKRAPGIARRAAVSGADIIQLRCKGADTKTALRSALAIKRAVRGKALFIVNDRVDVALAAGSDGLHIGKGDVNPALASKLLGKRAVIGISVSDAADIAAAKKSGPDYLGIGPVFSTPIKSSKPAVGCGIFAGAKKLGIPLFAIGGINGDNIDMLKSKGIKSAAVIRAVCLSGDPSAATRRLKEALVR